MRKCLPFGISICHLMLKFALATFVFGSKDEFSTLPKELLTSWMEENKYGGLYGKSDMVSIVIIPDCEDNELIDVTINSILLTSNRNLLHEIIVLSNDCQGIGKDIKSIIGKNFLDKPLIKLVETELQELGELQNLGASNSTGEIILFVSSATLFPVNWMSQIIRSLSDNFNSIAVPRLKKLSKDNWKFSNNDPIYSPKIMFTRKDFDLINIHTQNNKVPMFYSRIFAITKSWWTKISKLSDPTINLIFKSSINLDISLRSWNCGGRVALVELSFGVSKVNIPQPSFEVRKILLESWIDEKIAEYILRNSERLVDFMNSSTSLFETLINTRRELINEFECSQKNVFTSKFYNELNDIGIIEYPRSQIVLHDSELCFTLTGETRKGKEKSFDLKLLECEADKDSQAFYIDNKRNIIRHLYSNTCLSVEYDKTDPSYENKKVVLVECNVNNIYTHIEYWKRRLVFGSYCMQPGEQSTEVFISKCISEDNNSKTLQEYSIRALDTQ
ncbi:UDP-N-acetylgalactosamine: polypeptide N-acetylgalactosaminyltransferase [Cryptosporidium canis]|uniref:UDP-N-acetylgalactosamine: polypeptide N-acetylgalactosaminyltransferase n=1 Tax=Cryptosporidium canis TaxID=195482 RepID=A0ABQ8P9U7_9CRYT|nr:UDP-N-acetylgalactosamine: polypeptide N-acetylgalactosaminyltransferase [Cryptosporidium canis]KAJ1614112.1 UDP-N-acetylgalactosamine: polypeptide N-acetylgalactosaminyltransferase [Cryptosporidium canis]